MSDMSAIPATVGGKTIGARTKGRIKLLILFELFAKIQANGTPNVSEIKAAKVEVQIDNLMAVKSESDPKKIAPRNFCNQRNQWRNNDCGRCNRQNLGHYAKFHFESNPLLCR